MTEACCCPPEAGNASCDLSGSLHASSCPACLKPGKRLDSITLKALLDIPLTEMRPVEYRFCGTPECPVVYFSHDGAQTFRENHLHERVYQKHVADGNVFVCYCFRYTAGSIKDAFASGEIDAILDNINTGIQAGQCACDLRNPQGSCCLGNVRALMKNLEAIQV